MAGNTYEYTGGWQKFVVPKGVTFVDVVMRGAGSGTTNGGRVEGRMTVKAGQELWMVVGRRGNLNSGATGGAVAFGGGGRGGNGNGGTGGDGGGGATYIRLGSKTGSIRAVAGGAGGASGDGGSGGQGGAAEGAPGVVGTSGTGLVGVATGGTQIQSGRAGTSSAGASFNGAHGSTSLVGLAGAGGGPNVARVHGGGGGGGGYRPGGGGQAASIGNTPGGGGGGGSNYIGGLSGGLSQRGTGNDSHGTIVLTWINPNAANDPPSAPSDVKIEGRAAAKEMATKAKRSVRLTGRVDDPQSGQEVRLRVRMSKSSSFTRSEWFNGTYGRQARIDATTLTGLENATLYYLRIYTQDSKGQLSRTYRAASFWTNRPPSEPELTGPGENTQYTSLMNIPFTWNHRDPDGGAQGGFQFHFRRAGSPSAAPGPWSPAVTKSTSAETWTVTAGAFKGNSFYEWTVRTQDQQNDWGGWAEPRSLYVTADATPPEPLSPVRDHAVDVAEPVALQWKYRDPNPGTVQVRADVRWRIFETGEWRMLTGDLELPGADTEWVLPENTFGSGIRYEWQVRTYTSTEFVSDWSDSATFWGTAPGSAVREVRSPVLWVPAPSLGSGHNRAFIYARGGEQILGEIGKTDKIVWGRKRDDISIADVDVSDLSNREFLSSIRSLMHELVIFRDGERVWEGPITSITYPSGKLRLQARDVMFWPYRRIMRQGYNDAYRLVNGQQVGLRTVVERATLIVMNCLAYDDPNVLDYLTPITHESDARQSRSAPDYSRMAWEEIDDIAATGGLDYTVVGRRIVFWDTHQPLGRLPEMRSGDFADPPVVSEYGVATANHFGVTNNNGVYGIAQRGVVDRDPLYYGWVEQLASAYGETASTADSTTLTRTAKENLSRTLSEQADRNISGRWPTPLIVRVPDNTTLNPDINIGIQQLVPGVWIPLRAEHELRELAQWQKLDSITVTEEKTEKITVVMSPAPNAGEDPDADQAAIEESEG
jgi:hypothetical protein